MDLSSFEASLKPFEACVHPPILNIILRFVLFNLRSVTRLYIPGPPVQPCVSSSSYGFILRSSPTLANAKLICVQRKGSTSSGVHLLIGERLLALKYF